MTREELKKRIEQIVEMFDVSVVNGIAEIPLTKEDRESLDMAISALSENTRESEGQNGKEKTLVEKP